MIRKLGFASFSVGMAAAVVVACVGDDPGASSVSPDAAPGVDGGDSSDASADATPSGACNLGAPWQEPVPLNSVNSAGNDQRPSLSADELTIYFSSRRTDDGNDAGVSRIFVATRADANTDSFATPTALSEAVNRPGYDTIGSALSNDRRRLYFAARAGSGPHVIHEAVRSAVQTNTWVDATIKTIGGDEDSGVSDFSPFIANDGTLYFARTAAQPNFDVFRAAPDGSGGFKTPTVIGELTSEQDDSDPTPSPDGLTMYFSSSRPGSLDTDIWAATRASTSTGYGSPTRVADLSSTGRDVPGWISPDGCRFYLVSTRPGGKGQLDIFVASKPK